MLRGPVSSKIAFGIIRFRITRVCFKASHVILGQSRRRMRGVREVSADFLRIHVDTRQRDMSGLISPGTEETVEPDSKDAERQCTCNRTTK